MSSPVFGLECGHQCTKVTLFWKHLWFPKISLCWFLKDTLTLNLCSAMMRNDSNIYYSVWFDFHNTLDSQDVLGDFFFILNSLFNSFSLCSLKNRGISFIHYFWFWIVKWGLTMLSRLSSHLWTQVNPPASAFWVAETTVTHFLMILETELWTIQSVL